jgi:hypothetical protein
MQAMAIMEPACMLAVLELSLMRIIVRTLWMQETSGNNMESML